MVPEVEMMEMKSRRGPCPPQNDGEGARMWSQNTKMMEMKSRRGPCHPPGAGGAPEEVPNPPEVVVGGPR